ncbi:MAG: hypothetical protein ACRC57_05075 [Sarcina sp.]
MKELNIKNTTMEEFKKNFDLENDMPKSYHVSELGSLMVKGDDKVYFLIEDRLYEEPVAKVYSIDEITQDDVKKLEKLHDDYRDSLVDYREFLYYRNGEADSEEAKVIKEGMNEYLKEAKIILVKYNMKNEEDLKKVSTKFFIPDFTNTLFEVNNFNIIDEIDCGC